MLGVWGGLGRRGWGRPGAQGAEPRAQSAGTSAAWTTNTAPARTSQDSGGTLHRKVTATGQLYIISRRAARHLLCTLAVAALRGPTAWEPGWGARTAGTRNGDARNRELGTKSWVEEMGGTRSGKRKQGCGGQRAGSGSGITERDRGVAPLGDPTRPGRAKRSGPSVRGATPPLPAHLHAPYLSGFVELLLQPCHRHDGMREAAWRAATGAEMWRGGRRAAAGPAAAGATGAGARRGTRACAERHPDVRAGDAAS